MQAWLGDPLLRISLGAICLKGKLFVIFTFVFIELWMIALSLRLRVFKVPLTIQFGLVW